MERHPLLLKPESIPVSQTATADDSFDFQFPIVTNAVAAIPSDIVFCGKVLTRQAQTEPDSSHKRKKSSSLRSQSFSKLRSARSISGEEKHSESFRWPRNDSSRKHSNGLFGIVKYPVQMELSEIKKRQGRRDPVPLPEFRVDEGGELVVIGGRKNSRWELLRPMRPRDILISALAKASLGCIPLV